MALGLVAGLVVVSSGLFTKLLASSDKSGDGAIGLQLAERVLQEAVLSKYFPPTPVQRSLYLYSHDAANPQEFVYQISALPKVFEVGQPACYYMDVVVTWRGGQKSGQGQLQAKLSRLVAP